MAGVKKSPYIAPLPNPGSEWQTPASLIIDIHYMNLLLVERWTWERFTKLCLFLKMTSYEVASLVLLPHKKVEEYRVKNILPLKRAHASSVALSLTLLEAYLMRGLTNDVIENPFPNLARLPVPEMAGRKAEGVCDVAQSQTVGEGSAQSWGVT